MKLYSTSKKYSQYIVEGSSKFKICVANDEIKTVNNRKTAIQIKKNGHDIIVIKYKNKNYYAEIVEKKQNSYIVLINGNSYEFMIETPTSHKRKKLLTKSTENIKDYELKAPMPGKVIDVFIEKGSTVKPGDTLFTLEAMKMQNEILSEIAGEIIDVNISSGENVMKDQIVLKAMKV